MVCQGHSSILISIQAIKVKFIFIRKQYELPFLVPGLEIFSEGQSSFFTQFRQSRFLLSLPSYRAIFIQISHRTRLCLIRGFVTLVLDMPRLNLILLITLLSIASVIAGVTIQGFSFCRLQDLPKIPLATFPIHQKFLLLNRMFFDQQRLRHSKSVNFV